MDLIAQVVRTTPELEEAVFAALDEQRKKEIAERIKELREASRYTQPALADELGYKTVRGYQKAEAEGGMEFWRYEKLAKLHGVSVDYILRGNRPEDDLPQLDRMEKRIDDLAAVVEDLARTMGELAAASAPQEKRSKQRPASRKSSSKKK